MDGRIPVDEGAAHALIDDASRAEVGRVRSSRHPVVATDFQRWALAIGDRNPLWFDAAVARAHGHPGLVMPPLFLPHLLRGPVATDGLALDGSRLDALLVALPRCSRLVAGGDEHRFDAPLHDGDDVEAARTLAALTPKIGRTGPFLLVEQHTVFRRGGDVVAESRTTVVALP